MALINCPQCGGSVSDSAQKCVHCGCSLLKINKEEEQAKRQDVIYGRLPENEQKQLQKEFNALYPEEAAFENKRKTFEIVNFIMFAVFVVGVILDLTLTIFGDEILESEFTSIALIVVLCLLVGAYIIWLPIFYILRRKLKIRGYQNIKRFGKWLKEEKGITYKLALSEKEKAIFNTVKI